MLLVLCSSFTLTNAQQNNDLAVLHMQSKGKYNRVFNPQTNLKKLLDIGTQKQATIEFWAMHNTLGSFINSDIKWSLTNFSTEVFSLDINISKISININGQKRENNLLLGDQLFKNSWNHFAISFDKNAQEIRVYINGIERLFTKTPTFDVQNLYLTSNSKTDLFLAEYRTWSTLKSKEQIELQQYQSFYKNSKNSLKELKDNGLRVVYTNHVSKDRDYFGNQKLVTTSWRNMLYDYFPEDNLVENAEFTSAYKNTNVATLSSDINHPILNLNKIIVNASNGDGSDHVLLSGSHGVVVEWNHHKDADEYQILRKNVRSGTLSTLIHTEQNVSNKTPSEKIIYVDKGVLPNELYEYTIQAKKQGANLLTGKDIGFVLPNGKVNGTIETSSRVATKFAKVEAKTEANPGGALHIETNSKPLLIKNIDAFRKSKNKGTFEFWYKTPTLGNGDNKILKIGNGEIILKKHTITVTLNGNVFLKGNRTSDTKWHHYAFTYGDNGAMLFQDGNSTPIASTTNKLTLDLLSVNCFSLCEFTNTAYYLDEVRFWDVFKTPLQIQKYANHIIGGKVPNLFAYYRFDFNDIHKAYNFSTNRKGKYSAQSETPLKHLAATEQPKITYATYTDEMGNYEFTSLSTGIQGITNNDTKFEYTIEPSKPRFEFLPRTKQAGVPRRLNGAEVTNVSFTDVSSLPVTGVISYRVGKELYPVTKGTALRVDGSLIQSVEDTKVTTDNTGTYAIKVAPGKHIITPNVRPSLTHEERLNEGSLGFDGKTGYGESNQTVDSDNKSFMWSGFVKPYLKKKNKDIIPATQTILQWGDLSLKLINNTTFKVFSGTQEILSEGTSTAEQTQFVFFGISYNKVSGTMTLYVNNRKKSTAISTLNIVSKVVVGAENVNNKFTNYAKSHLDLLEYRATALIDDDVRKLREGKYIATNISKLALSYSFDQRNGRRAINIANISNAQNNYIQLNEGCSFDNTTRKQYIREVEYSYRATNVTYNPKGNSYEVVVEEPLQNVHFENATRHSFIGAIVVPCNNNVGAWTGKIVRTDIEFPKFEKTITNANFNNDNTIFTVNDLLPGQYRVEITNVASNRKLQSPIIDLRRGNAVYDFEYRNPIEIEVEMFNFDIAGIRDKNARDFIGSKISETCDGKFILSSNVGFKMDIKVFERYGAEKCPVEGAEITLGGDAVLLPSGKSMKHKTLSKGVLEVYAQTSSPNFSGDNTRNFLISVKNGDRNTSLTKKTIITGARQGNSDFTLIDPEVGFVLHDPPGDNSFATLAKGATYSYSLSSENGIGTAIDNSLGQEVHINSQLIIGTVAAPLGVGTMTALVNPTVNLNSDTQGQIGGEFNYIRHSGSIETVSLEKAISTPSDPTFVGEDADVFIGMSKVISFGTGKVLEMNGCTPVVKNSDKVAKPTSLTPFVFTKQSLVDNVIPNLYRLAIAKSDKNNNVVSPPKDRNHLDLKGTLDKLLVKNPKDKEDKDIVNYLHQITSWNKIIDDNHKKLQAAAFNTAPDFSKTTKKLTNDNDHGQSGVGINPATLDRRITFDGLTEISYTLSREKSKNSGNSFTEAPYVGVSFSKDFKVFGVGLGFSNQTRIHNFNSQMNSTDNGNNRVDSFTFKDDDAGDQFDVSIKRDKQYDTPMFLTNGGRSSCPFESGTVPREGVELIVDKVVGYGTGSESVLFNLTLRNTQIAKDATRKTYIVGMSGASNPLGAVVNLNESPIFEPTTSSKFVFDLDPKSPTGVKQEIKAQLRISRGTDAPSVISYENIKIQMYSECEQEGDRYRSYGVDEYNEVGVKPLSEILVTAHFTGACIESVTADAPQNDWVVNGSDKKKLDFKFKVPGLVKKDDKLPINDFSIDLEYTIKGNNMPKVLKKLDLMALKASLNEKTGFIEYSADVSGLANGEYNFRIVPVCGDGGSDNPNNRKNPTPFVKGKIARQSPRLVLTTPGNGGIFTTGTISAKFSAPINPATVNLNSLAMRGVLGGIPKPLTSVKFDNIQDSITIPHVSKFNLEEKATIEMWINPEKYPTTGSVPIIRKGNNYAVLLASDGKIDLGNGIKSSVGLQPFTWTHVAVIADKVNGKATIYFNGRPVGSGNISTMLKTNEDPILIAPVVNNDAFVGSLDEIRLWRSLRTPTQLVSNMKNQLLGNEDTLEAYFVFNNNALAKQGLNGNPNEAIQDFTGNASGTTANGITFVTNEEAAPLDQTKTVDDVQFTTTMSENNTIINFNMKISDLEFIEGARLTVFVKDKKLEDPLGNKVDKTSWSFIIDRSKLKWSHNNISISQNQGEETTIDYVDLVNKDGGVDVAYTFENLPVWFEVKSGANGEKDKVNTIKARETNSNLVFETKSFLNPGVHSANIYIKTSNKDTGVKLGVESFRLEVVVTCPEPVIPQSFKNEYPFSMNFKGNLLIDGQKSFDVNDAVTVYVGDKPRGYTKVEANGLLNLTAYGNASETSALTFKVWDASECTEYEGIIENYSFAFNTSQGTNTAPVKFTVGKKVKRRIPVVTGFQELSFNLKDTAAGNTLSLSAIKGLPNKSEILDITNPTQKAVVGADGNFTGSLTAIDISKAYLVRVSTNQVKYIVIAGIPLDINTNVNIKGDKVVNVLPYYPNDLQRTGYALRSFTSTNVSEGDRIERRGLFAEYSVINGWRGSLTHLTPGFGYIFKSAKNGTINYTGIIKSVAAKSVVPKNNSISHLSSKLEETPSPKNLGLDFNENVFANFMYINGVIDDSNLDSDNNFTILAFVGDELRGISKSEFINNQFQYYIGIGGDLSKDVQFKLYDGINLYDLENKELFTPNEVLGDLNNPYRFRLAVKTINESVKPDLYLSQNTPNPMSNYSKIQFSLPKDSYAEINLYNMAGQNLGVLTSGKFTKGQHTFNWDGTLKGKKLSNGTYIYDLQYKGKRVFRKLIIVK